MSEFKTPDSGFPEEVIDEKGALHTVKGLISAGGQGAVFRTNDPCLAIKLIDTYDPLPVVKESLEKVQLLPVEDLHITRPERLLSERPGYIMRLMTGMELIEKLVIPPEPEKNPLEQFKSSGGLKRRYAVLGKLAALFSRIHSRGLSYMDLNEKNVFISQDPNRSEVWVIDPDNLDLAERNDRCFLTPSFAAPEYYRGDTKATCFSDIWSFAVLAYQILSTQHPFDAGNLVANSEVEILERVRNGEIPWIEDMNDPRNRTDTGLPGDLVLTPRLRDLFEKTFASGRADPRERPGMGVWAHAFFHALDTTVSCNGCGMDHLADHNPCPWCEPAHVLAPHLRFSSFLFDPDWDEETKTACHSALPFWTYHLPLSNGKSELLPERIFRPFSLEGIHRFPMRIDFYKNGIILQTQPESGSDPFYYCSNKIPEPQVIRDLVKFNYDTLTGQDISVFQGRPDWPHRVVKLERLGTIP